MTVPRRMSRLNLGTLARANANGIALEYNRRLWQDALAKIIGNLARFAIDTR